MMNEKQVVSYTDVVLNAWQCVKDISDDNKVDFDANLGLFIEGLQQDIEEFEAGGEVYNIPVRQKEQQDVEEF